MSRFDGVDFFTDPSLIDDPHPYFEHLRARGPVTPLPSRNVVAVTGYEEGLAVFRDDERFSAIQAVSGPIPPLAVHAAGRGHHRPDRAAPPADAVRSAVGHAGPAGPH